MDILNGICLQVLTTEEGAHELKEQKKIEGQKIETKKEKANHVHTIIIIVVICAIFRQG